MAEWQDISTAPKDGSTVLIWDEEVLAAEFVFGVWEPIGWDDHVEIHPTHWMPLPDPPA